jgi:hypothetical protein
METIICPEKFSDDITVEIIADTEEHCIIVLASQAGRTLRMMGVNVNEGKNQIQISDVHVLEAGTYELSVKNKNSNILYRSTLTKF